MASPGSYPTPKPTGSCGSSVTFDAAAPLIRLFSMATYRIEYSGGYGEGGVPRETVEADDFKLDGTATWMDFYGADSSLILRIRADLIYRIQRVLSEDE